MFGSNVIDILIGLIVVFLSVGLAVSAGTELISQWLKLRPQQLKKALAGMLDGSLATGTSIPEKHWFFNQALLRSMADWGDKFPSYLDRKTFSEALLLAIDKDFASKTADELATSLEQSLEDLPINAGVKQLIRNYVRQSKGDVLKFQELVGDWFDRVMDRTSGWYRRNVAMINLVLAAVIVVAANIDTLAIARALHGSDELRARMLEVAGKLAVAPPIPAPTPSAPDASAAETPPAEEQTRQRLAALKTEYQSMQSAGLPLGWEGKMPTASEWFAKIIGWLITIGAAVMGAPFWFDMLSKIINIRSAGPKPVTKTDVVSPPVKEDEH
jgi:hypothetical protein